MDAPNNESDCDVLNYAQTAHYLNLPLGTLYSWVHLRKVPHIRLGPRLVRFSRSALDAWLAEATVTAAGGRER